MKFHSIKPLRLALAALICTASAVSLAQQTTENTAESSEPSAEEPGETAPAAPVAPVVAQGPQLLEQAPAVLPDGTTFPTPQVHVYMNMVILMDGTVGEVTITQGAGEPFDSVAVAALKSYKFEPARDPEGNALAVMVNFDMLFEEPPPPPTTLNYRLLQRGTRKPLAGAEVVAFQDDSVLARGTSDAQGNVQLIFPAQACTVSIVAAGHEKYEITYGLEIIYDEDEEEILPLNAGESRDETLYLLRSVEEYQTIVRGRKAKREVTRRVIERDDVLKVAGTQGDAIRVIENLPGTARDGGGGGGPANGPVLRGSNPGDSKIYIEGHEIPILYHFGGLRSTFNSAFLESVDFVPGNFGTEFGRATGGVVEVNVRDLAKDMFRGNVDFNLYDAGFVLEGPIGSDWTLGGAFHRSYIDTLLPIFLPEEVPLSFNTAPRYYDYQFIAQGPVLGDDDLRFFFFGSLDKVELLFDNAGNDPLARGDLNARTMFHRLQAQYRSKLSDKLSQDSSVMLGLTKTDFSFGPELYFDLGVYSMEIRSKWEYLFSEALTFTGGMDWIYNVGEIALNLPRPPQEGDNSSPASSRDDFQSIEEAAKSYTPALFAEVLYKPTETVELIGGTRFDYSKEIKKFWFDPRALARWQAAERTTLTGGVGLYQRVPDPWESDPEFGNPDIFAERSVHASAGVEQVFDYGVRTDITGFYKWVDRIVVSNPDSLFDESAPSYVNDGSGRIYGAEFLIRYNPTSKFSGWLAYSYSKSFRRDSPDAEERLFDADQPHNLTLISTYKFNAEWQVGARFRLISGNPDTPITGAVYDADGDVWTPVYGENNSTRLPMFAQLDLRVDYNIVYPTWILNIYLDIQNATNRGNQEGWAYQFDYQARQPQTGLPILPIIGVNASW